NDFVPKTKVSKGVTAPKVEVVVNPEENNVPVTKTKDGMLQGTCYINGLTSAFIYDTKEKELYISPEETLKLLKEGVIDKTSFDGDPAKILGEGKVADKAVVTIKEIRIGKNTVSNLKATVNKKISSLQFGEPTLKKFGKFSVDAANGEIIFE
ncbi:MAG: hypothetical protein WCK34_14850, partial [Bacteroidota bacterium]